MIRRLFPALLSSIAAATADELPPQSLAVSADTPTVEIEARVAGRGFIALPTLEFRFLLEPECGAGWQPRAVSLGIADTRLTLTPEPAAGAMLEARLTVPAAQLAPLPVAGFCEAPAAPSGESPPGATADTVAASPAQPGAAQGAELTIAAAASAQAALLCASNGSERLTFVARPLAVTLVCSGTSTDPAASD